MGSPNIESSVTRPDLKNRVYREWDASGMSNRFVADLVLPQLDVDKKSATVKVITREQYLTRTDDSKAPDGGYHRTGFGAGEVNYDCVARGIEAPVDADSAAEMSSYFNSEREAAEIALFKAKMEHEIRVAALVFNETTFTGYTTSAAIVWSNATSSTPIADVTTGIQTMQEATGGTRPDSMLISAYGWDKLKECDQITDRLGMASSRDPKIARLDTVAALLDLKQIVVGDAYYNTAKEGATTSLSRIWDKTYALLFYSNPSPQLKTPFLGATLHWTGRGSQFNFRFESYYKEEIEANIVRVRRHVVPKVFNAEFGWLISGINA